MRTLLNSLTIGLFLLMPFIGQAEQVNPYVDFEKELVKSNFSGLLLVMKGDEVKLQGAYGVANRERNIPFKSDTVFDIGSLTKQFVASAIMHLQQSKRWSVDDTLQKYFPSAPKDKRKITIHHLLTHSSGLPTNLGGGLYRVVSPKKLVTKIFKKRLKFPPGKSYSYSNLGYSLLVQVIYKVSGLNWEQYISQHLFSAAAMRETGYRLVHFDDDRLASNYGADQTFLQRVLSIDAESRSVGDPLQHLREKSGMRWAEGAGLLVSTLADIKSWYQVVRKRQVLNTYSWAEMFKPHVRERDEGESYYGYGWSTWRDERAGKVLNHNGSNGYSFVDLYYFPKLDAMIFIATNEYDNFPTMAFDKFKQGVIETF